MYDTGQSVRQGFNLEKSVCFGSGNVVRVSGRGRVRHSDGGDFS